MSVIRRVVRPIITTTAPPPGPSSDEITYKGYRIEPESYFINRMAWSPRVVVSVRTDGRWTRATPLYSPDAARFPTREEADRRAVEVAKQWIDTAAKQVR